MATSAAISREPARRSTPTIFRRLGCLALWQRKKSYASSYYDCALFNGQTRLPISRAIQIFTQTTPYLHDLAQKDLFAVRCGTLKFRGYVVRRGHTPSSPPVDSDFAPKFEQKGVDMRIGLDMATIAGNRSAELIALMTNDTDCVPAMKLVRRSGIQVALVCVPNCSPAPELLTHSDFKRVIPWP